jgi:hypothetical protein
MKNVATQVQQLAHFPWNQGGATRTFATFYDRLDDEPQDPSTMAMSSLLLDKAFQILNMQPTATWSHIATHAPVHADATSWDIVPYGHSYAVHYAMS